MKKQLCGAFIAQAMGLILIFGVVFTPIQAIAKQVNLTIICVPSNGGTTSPESTISIDQNVEFSVSATPNKGYEFANWATPTPETTTILAPEYTYATVTLTDAGSLLANFITVAQKHIGVWVPTGTMPPSTGGGPAPTLLDNGKVLAWDALFDPAIGTWTATGSAPQVRYCSSTTLLDNGKVLVAGGQEIGISYTCDLFDTTGAWTTTGGMTQGRYAHTATLLQNGKVLVVGGNQVDYYSTICELFDPSTGIWTSTGSAAENRFRHTATLLQDGKVLVTGGCLFDVGYELASCEIFDPATGTWTSTGAMTQMRSDHAATLLQDGKVLVTGGCGGDGSILTTCEIFNPGTGTWTVTGDTAQARYSTAATLLQDGKVLVAGGGSNDLTVCEIFDPVTGIWTATGSMASKGHTVLLQDGKVLAVEGGGYCELFEKNLIEGWCNSAGGTTEDQGSSVAVDGSGNTYITGKFSGTATFGGYTLTSQNSSYDVFVAKYNFYGVIQWAKSAGGIYSDYSNSIAVDSNGNCYLTGSFTGSADFDNFNLKSLGTSDVFIAKYSSSGTCLWAKRAGGPDVTQAHDDAGNGIAIDMMGNIYVTGDFYEIADFGNYSITSAGEYDIFIAKYDSSGNCQWARRAGGTGGDIGKSIAVDSSANTYVTGYFNGTADFGTYSLTSKGYEDIFVTKYDAAGNCLWAERAGGTSGDSGKGVAVDADGNCYICGNFWTAADFGTINLISNGMSDAFVAKYDSTGKCIWAKNPNGKYEDSANSICVDPSGDADVTGNFYQSIDFGDGILSGTGTELFIARYSSSGEILKAIEAGGAGNDIGIGIVSDSKSDTYVTGYYEGQMIFEYKSVTSQGGSDIFIAKMRKHLYSGPQLTIICSPANGGTCTPSGIYNAKLGEVVNVSASPASGFIFTQWTVAGNATVQNASSAATTATVNGNSTLTANFILASSIVQLTMAVSPSSSGTTIPSVGAHTVSKNVAQNITATPVPGYIFIGWSVSGGASIVDASSSSTSVTLTADASVTANFESDGTAGTLIIAANPSGGLTKVTWSNETSGEQGEGIGEYSFITGDTISVQSTASTNYDFVNYTFEGDIQVIEKTGNSIRFKCPQNGRLTAIFRVKGSAWSATYSPSNTELTDINADETGNAYVVGDFKGTFDLSAGFDYTANGTMGFFAKYNGTSGNVEWLTPLLQTFDNLQDKAQVKPYYIRKDSNGDYIVAGEFQDAAFPDYGFTNEGSASFVTKYDNTGKIKWLKQFGEYDYTTDGTRSIPKGVACGNSGSIYLIGDALSDDPQFTADGSSDSFIVKYDGTGSPLWQTNISTDTATSCDISVDSSENSYVIGEFTGLASFNEYDLTSDGTNTNYFLCKYDSGGNVNWARKFGNNLDYDFSECGSLPMPSVRADANGNVFVFGMFSQKLSFQDEQLFTSAGSMDYFLAKIDSSGVLNWSKKIELPDNISISGDDYNYLFDGSTPAIKLCSEIGGNGNINISAPYINRVIVDEYTLTAAGSSNMFLINCDSKTGSVIAAKNIGTGTSKEDSVAPRAISSGGDSIYAIGNFHGQVNVCDYEFSSMGTGTFMCKTSEPGAKPVLMMSVSPSGSGTTTPASGSSTTVNSGEKVNISATPAAGYKFSKWTSSSINAIIANENTAATNVTLTGSSTVTANFAPEDTFLLTVGSGTGGGSYSAGASVPIIANSPAVGKTFDTWTGDVTYVADAGQATTSVTMPSKNIGVAATYKEQKYQLTIAVSPQEGGLATPGGVSAVSANTPVDIRAYPSVGYHFTNWIYTGNVNIDDAESMQTVITINSDAVVTANFEQNAPTAIITIACGQGGSTNPAVGSSTISTGSPVSITAIPNLSYHFLKWSVTGNGSVANTNSANTTVTILGDTTVTASFEANTAGAVLTMAIAPSASGTTEPASGSVTNVNTGVATTIKATANEGYNFISWTASSANGNIADAISTSTTVTLNGNVTITAIFSENVAVDKMAYGKIYTMGSSAVTGLDDFEKVSSVYATFKDPVKNKIRTASLKVLSKPSKESPLESVDCEWKGKVTLFDVKKWNPKKTCMENLGMGAIDPMDCTLYVSALDSNGHKVKKQETEAVVTLVPPEISMVYDEGGLEIGVASTGQTIRIKGKMFGSTAPSVWLEYFNDKGIVKSLKLKIVKSYKYADASGKSGKSVMDPESGDSEITVMMPTKWPKGWGHAVNHNLVIDNKVGRATIQFKTSE